MAGNAKRLLDYRVEHILMGGAAVPGKDNPATGLPRWQQQVQYTVGHTLNDFYSLSPEVRRETPIQSLVERRWPQRDEAFHSFLQYWDIKSAESNTMTEL
ncbi:hypothetical protein [Paenibacillus sp. sgz500958]|uniref:hypothetical protein n=1 Tax=Paenibacillus sp. sgz500958 TaxID=3242475 RepID=UPI0036D3594E